MPKQSGPPADPGPVETEETVDERSKSTVSGGTEGPGSGAPPSVPFVVVADSEVPERAKRRRYSAEYKLRILEAVEACEKPGEVGALLRREGIYSSHLNTWRKQRARGVLEGLEPRKRGRQAKPTNPLSKRVAELERENARLQKRLKQAEIIIDVQKKVSQILGIPLNDGSGEKSE